MTQYELEQRCQNCRYWLRYAAYDSLGQCRFNSAALMEALRQSDQERLQILELRAKLAVAKDGLKYYTHAVSPLSQVAIDTLARLNVEEKK